MRKMIFVGRIMSSPDSDGNVQRFIGGGCQVFPQHHARVDAGPDRDSRLDDGEHLAFGDDVVNVDEHQFKFARCR